MRTFVVILIVQLMCAGCGDETAVMNGARANSSYRHKANGHVLDIEREIAAMPQRLEGGPTAMHWGFKLANSIIVLDDKIEKKRLMSKYIDSLSRLMALLDTRRDRSMAFYSYEFMMDSCTVFGNEPGMVDRFFEIICECVRLHKREVKKWADAIEREPNRRLRTPLKNIHVGYATYFTVFTNRIERDYFPWMKSHGLSADRQEHWRRQLDAAYEMKEPK